MRTQHHSLGSLPTTIEASTTALLQDEATFESHEMSAVIKKRQLKSAFLLYCIRKLKIFVKGLN